MKSQENQVHFLERESIRRLLPYRPSNSHKGNFGKALLICGSKGMAGAAYLAGKAAYLSGVGMVRIYTPEENRIVLQTLLPQAMVSGYQEFQEEELQELLNWADVIGIGCGLSLSDISQKIFTYVWNHSTKPMVVDADALTLLSRNMEWLEKSQNRELILTPHGGEFSSLLSRQRQEWIKEKESVVHEFCQRFFLTCILKEGRPLIGKRGRLLVQSQVGNQGMAKAGSGDILTGILVALLGQKMEGYEASILGTYLHGKAGDCAREKRGTYSILAEDLLDELANVWKEEEAYETIYENKS